MIKGPARGQWTLHVSGDNNDNDKNDKDDDDDVSAEHRPHEVQDGDPQRDHQTRHRGRHGAQGRARRQGEYFAEKIIRKNVLQKII